MFGKISTTILLVASISTAVEKLTINFKRNSFFSCIKRNTFTGSYIDSSGKSTPIGEFKKLEISNHYSDQILESKYVFNVNIRMNEGEYKVCENNAYSFYAKDSYSFNYKLENICEADKKLEAKFDNYKIDPYNNIIYAFFTIKCRPYLANEIDEEDQFGEFVGATMELEPNSCVLNQEKNNSHAIEQITPSLDTNKTII